MSRVVTGVDVDGNAEFWYDGDLSNALRVGIRRQEVFVQLDGKDYTGNEEAHIYISPRNLSTITKITSYKPIVLIAPIISGTVVVGDTVSLSTGTYQANSTTLSTAPSKDTSKTVTKSYYTCDNSDGTGSITSVAGTGNTNTVPNRVGKYIFGQTVATNAEGSTTTKSNVLGPITAP